MPIPVGQVINDRYRVVRLLGQGGYGAVYQVWDLRLERHEALKENLSVSPESERQFKREAIFLSRLAHPNLPRVIDHFFLPEKGQYLVMDYIAGQDLQGMIEARDGPLDEASVLDWAEQVCRALEYLHAQAPPIIHRDVKPSNIRITPQGQAMLVDFGIAKAYEPGEATTSGARAVSMGFSPLEQYGRAGRTDARTDVYALGATLYFALTGRTPTDALDRSLGEPLSDVRRLNPAVSEHVASAVMTALAIYPDQRPPTMADFRKLLHGQTELGRTVVQPASPAVAPKPISRPPGRPGGSNPAAQVVAPAIELPAVAPHGSTGFPWLYAVLVAGVLAVFAGVMWAGMRGLGGRQAAALPPASGGAVTQPVIAGMDDPGAGGPASPTPFSLALTTSTAQPPSTDTPLPTATLPPGRITEVIFCDRPCNEAGAEQQLRFPEGTSEIYFAIRYENMHRGTPYVRTWMNQEAGEEWVRYECTWQGPEDGVFYGRLWDSEGLRSGAWVVSVELDGQGAFQEVVFVEGDYDLWTPAGMLPCNDW
jgi:tRNA A-37 threonylcarbamoyl transferase component Bud32